MRNNLRLLSSALLGLGVFLIPIPIDGRWTVLFDLAVKALTKPFPVVVSIYCLALIAYGAWSGSSRSTPGPAGSVGRDF
ncbi:MAG: hypothetical protein HN348_08435, partial [Proteobacteria bacterium]|nr:hypothetical protein [Pseudomonadota bacterium]